MQTCNYSLPGQTGVNVNCFPLLHKMLININPHIIMWLTLKLKWIESCQRFGKRAILFNFYLSLLWMWIIWTGTFFTWYVCFLSHIEFLFNGIGTSHWHWHYLHLYLNGSGNKIRRGPIDLLVLIPSSGFFRGVGGTVK